MDCTTWLEYGPKDAEIESAELRENVGIHSSDDNGALLSCEISVMSALVSACENLTNQIEQLTFGVNYTLHLLLLGYFSQKVYKGQGK
jgi:hypothetical protein